MPASKPRDLDKFSSFHLENAAKEEGWIIRYANPADWKTTDEEKARAKAA